LLAIPRPCARLPFLRRLSLSLSAAARLARGPYAMRRGQFFPVREQK